MYCLSSMRHNGIITEKEDLMHNFTDYKKHINNEVFKSTDKRLPNNLKIVDDGKISIYYAPFDYVNTKAKLVICGITPGFVQARNALIEASKQLKLEKTDNEVLEESKKIASFSGPMRKNLLAMLEILNLHSILKIQDIDELFNDSSELIHFTSLLRNPVFVCKEEKLENYSGHTPKILKSTLLKDQLGNIKKEIEQLSSDVLYIPLGERVKEVFQWLIEQKDVNLKKEQVYMGLEHPSGANNRKIKLFKENKDQKSKEFDIFIKKLWLPSV